MGEKYAKCAKCGKSDVRLYRPANQAETRCNGCVPAKDSGWWVPARPTGDGTYWGHTSGPYRSVVEWWEQPEGDPQSAGAFNAGTVPSFGQAYGLVNYLEPRHDVFAEVARWFVGQMEEIRRDERSPVGVHRGLALEAERRLRAALAGEKPEPSPLWSAPAVD